MQTDRVTTSYLRGINLISRTAGNTTEYYLFNAHGDVVNLVNTNGTVTKSYDYDAFGNEQNPSAADPNPFRYCGEYWDTETGTYYLRARYYAPDIGRFTQQDTHWNTANMIYGDNPHKINEREDGLGLTMYTHVPQITAVMQSGNRYVYAINNPMAYVDPNGQIILIDDLAFAAGVVVIAGSLIALIYLGHQTAELIEEAMNSREWKQIEAAIQNAASASAAAASGAPDPDDDWRGFSKNQVKHMTNRHNPHKFAQELRYLSKESAINKLQNRSFFNKNWSQQQIADAVNNVYQQALQAGVKNGTHSFSYLGEKITICLNNGAVETVYGHHVYTYEELLWLLG